MGDVIEVNAVDEEEVQRKGPLLYVKPKRPNLSEETIMVRWQGQTKQKAGGSPILGYELIWEAEALDVTHSKVTDGVFTPRLSHKMVGSKAVYRFRVRSKNVCGYGAFSNIVKMDARTSPAQMDSVLLSSTENACTSKISWNAPIHGGLPLQKFILEAKNSRGKFIQLKECGNKPSDRFCKIKLDQFYEPPFNLALGEMVQVRGSAVNSRGRGKYSTVNLNGPGVVIKPKITGPP